MAKKEIMNENEKKALTSWREKSSVNSEGFSAARAKRDDVISHRRQNLPKQESHSDDDERKRATQRQRCTDESSRSFPMTSATVDCAGSHWPTTSVSKVYILTAKKSSLTSNTVSFAFNHPKRLKGKKA